MSANVPDRIQGHCFVSYASVDRTSAVHVAEMLEASGIPVWIDRTGIQGGASWAEEIVGAIRAASTVLVLCSSASMQSRNVHQELQLAWDEARPILPVLLEPVDFPDAIAFSSRAANGSSSSICRKPNGRNASPRSSDNPIRRRPPSTRSCRCRSVATSLRLRPPRWLAVKPR